jgi:hypothetical protein
MPFKPPLTLRRLKEIGANNPDNPDVKELLWEIKRLHSIVLRGYQIVKTIPPDPKAGAYGLVSWGMWCDIKDDPIVITKEREANDIKPSDDD